MQKEADYYEQGLLCCVQIRHLLEVMGKILEQQKIHHDDCVAGFFNLIFTCCLNTVCDKKL